jgi:hypothetical protein
MIINAAPAYHSIEFETDIPETPADADSAFSDRSKEVALEPTHFHTSSRRASILAKRLAKAVDERCRNIGFDYPDVMLDAVTKGAGRWNIVGAVVRHGFL